jgi:DNA recombination protein RmuC
MSLESVPYLTLAFLIGLALCYLLLKSRHRAALAAKEETARQLESNLAEEGKRLAALESENRQIPDLKAERDRLNGVTRALEHDLGEKKAVANEVENLRQVRDAADKQIRRLDAENATLREQKNAMEVWYEKAKLDFSGMFATLSKDALKDNRGSFLDLAKESLGKYQEAAKGDLEMRQQAIEQHLTPIKEHLENVGRLNNEIKGQIGQLNETTRFVGAEASLLLRALRQPTGSGHYGEKLVRQILELSGMQEGIHFEEQVPFERNGKAYRADVVVNLSDGQRLVIDSKAPISAHLDYVQANDEKTREEKVKKLSQGLRDYAKDLQSKEYWKQFEPSAGIVIMFVAPESALMAAMQHDSSLWDDCVRRRILLSCPTMLVGMLLTVGFGWRQAKFADSAEQIQRIGQELYERLFTFSTNYLKLGQAITTIHERYKDALGTLDGSVFPSARRMKELGVPTGNKEIAEITLPGLEDKAVRSRELISLAITELPPAGAENLLDL